MTIRNCQTIDRSKRPKPEPFLSPRQSPTTFHSARASPCIKAFRVHERPQIIHRFAKSVSGQSTIKPEKQSRCSSIDEYPTLDASPVDSRRLVVEARRDGQNEGTKTGRASQVDPLSIFPILLHGSKHESRIPRESGRISNFFGPFVTAMG